MKSVITAAVLLIVSIFGCLYLSSAVSARIDELYKMTEALPQKQSTYKEHPAVYLSGCFRNCREQAPPAARGHTIFSAQEPLPQAE